MWRGALIIVVPPSHARRYSKYALFYGRMKTFAISTTCFSSMQRVRAQYVFLPYCVISYQECSKRTRYHLAESAEERRGREREREKATTKVRASSRTYAAQSVVAVEQREVRLQYWQRESALSSNENEISHSFELLYWEAKQRDEWLINGQRHSSHTGVAHSGSPQLW